jgi:hypothetical protein
MTLSKEGGRGGTTSFPYSSFVPLNIGIISCMMFLALEGMLGN